MRMNAWGKTEVATRQRTFDADGEKVTIKSRPRVYMHSFQGFYVWINGEKFLEPMAMDREAAENRAFSKWMGKK